MNKFVTAIAAGIMLAAICLAGAACSVDGDFASPNPDLRRQAIMDAGRSRDSEAVSDLVDCLGDDEAEVRLLAFVALKKITGGRTMGWHYAASQAVRTEALKRWRDWLQAGQPADWPDTSPQSPVNK